MNATLNGLVESDRLPHVVRLLERHCGGKIETVESLAGGKNNRVLKLVPISGSPLVLKAYFRSDLDKRDRLLHEYSFASLAWEQGMRNVPEPIAASREGQCALYAFVEGRRPETSPSSNQVAQAADFVRSINRGRESVAAAKLPSASEACFSLASHLATVDARLSRLESADLPPDLRRWFDGELVSVWRAIRGHVGETQAEDVDRILSPSDFGFHNALIRPDGETLCFLDFEYAGWDDPAKLFGDFFSQIEVPVAPEHMHRLASALLELSNQPHELSTRIVTLLPVYGIKWCCIALNPFLASDASRRQYAGQDIETARQRGFERAVFQLARAREYAKKKDWLNYG